MPRENNQKIKLLKIMELLRQKTDEDHPMSTTDICNHLVAQNITCDRRTLHKDMKFLNAQGYEVMRQLIDHENYYYVSDRSFSLPEIKILIDAVQAASFVTEAKTSELVDKLANLAGSHRAELLKGNLVCFNTRKHTNEKIYYNVGFLEDAIQQDKKIIFRYFDLNENGEKVYRREGHHYVVEPVALVFNEDNYYLVVYSAKHSNTANYRIDRMDSVEIIDEDVSEVAKLLRDSVSAMTESAFKMYGGQPTEVTLEFDEKLIGAVYDKFGEKTKMKRTGEHTITADVMVQISPTFWGWLFQFGKQIEIVNPIGIRERFREQASIFSDNSVES